MLRRRLMMNAMGEAAIAYGVYIQDIEGKLWKAGAWDGSATPNGVAVYDESCQFIIALGVDTQLPINPSSHPSSLTSLNTEEAAKADFDGAGNTEILLSDYGSVTTKAAGYCADYTFPNGEVGYLGSVGEWNVAFKYKDEIDAIMEFLGQSELNNRCWTSTYYGKDSSYYKFWVFWWNAGGGVSAGDIRKFNVIFDTYFVHPFGVLDIKGVGSGSGTEKILNKIEIKNGNIFGILAESQYPVASDITVTIEGIKKTYTVTIPEGEMQSNTTSISSGSIISVTPTEDDKYIYTF